jgi:hypothetical protein
MSRKVQRRLSPLRLACMVILLLGVLSTLVVLVRALPATVPGYLAAGLLGAAALPVMASPLEWLVHRHVYHRKLIPLTRRIYVIHHRGHHQAIFPTWRYVTNGPVRRHPIVASGPAALHTSSWRNLLIKLCHFAFYMTIGGLCVWLPAWLLTTNVGFLVGLIAASAAVSDLFVRVHDAIHYPGRHRFLEAQPWFGFLERHHYIHHVDTEANVNFLLPLADWLFGTMRRSLTPEELRRHGSLEEAKAHPVGMSEPAKNVARPRRLEKAAGEPGGWNGCGRRRAQGPGH